MRDPGPVSGPGRRRGWHGEEDDPIAGVADVWGLVCQLVLMRRRAVCDGRRAGPACQRQRACGQRHWASFVGYARERAGEAWLG